MASLARQHRTSDWMGGEERLVPVIADGGDQAWVVLVCFPTDPRVGDTFTFRGLKWTIVRPQDSARGFVAHPRPTPISDH